MRTVTIGSLFSGIGGLEMGLAQGLGMPSRVAFQVERDPFCLNVLEKQFPDARRYDNVIGFQAPYVDVLCGGFPCQDVSTAGKRAGLAGERSGLWWEFHRIIEESRPSVVVIENVAALAGRGLGDVLRSLAAVRYVGSWRVVSAAGVGAPHIRKRLFVVAANADRLELHEQSIGAWWSQSWERSSVAADDGETGGFGSAAVGDSCDEADRVLLPQWGGGAWRCPPTIRRMDDGFPSAVDGRRGGRLRALRARDEARFRALGNAVVPRAAAVAGRVAGDVLKEMGF